MFLNKGQDDEPRDSYKPNIFINPADYPRYVTSALMYSQAIERTKHVIYKNKCLAHRDQSRYPDHVTIIEKKGSQRRPWYHIHQCLDEKCPVHPENVRLPNVKEVDVKQGGIPNFLCSYLKDKVDISLYPYYRASIQSFNASFTINERTIKRSKVLSCLWHDPHCEGCEKRELHGCPFEERVVREEDIHEGEVNITDISDILYKYRFLFNPDYVFGFGEKYNTTKAQHDTINTSGNLQSFGVCTSKTNQSKPDEYSESLEEEVNKISTCVGQVPRTPTRQYSNTRYNTPRYQTPNRSPFLNWNQRYHQTNFPSPYYTPRQSTPNKSPFYNRNPYGQSASTTISPYSPTCLPYPSSSPYSTPPRHVYTPPIYHTNPYTQYYSLSQSTIHSNLLQSSALLNHYGYHLPASISQRSFPYAPDIFANYQGASYPNWYSSYNQPRSKSYSQDFFRSETDIKSYDDTDYDLEDPLVTQESRHNDDRRRESKYYDNVDKERRRSYDHSYKRNNDKRDLYRNSSRDRDYCRMSSSGRDRKSIDPDRKRRKRSSLSSSSSKRSKQTHSHHDNHQYTKRNSRKSTSNHSISSETTINYSELSPRKSSKSRRKSEDKSKDRDRRRSAPDKTRDGHRRVADRKKSSEEHSRYKSKSGRNCEQSSKRSNCRRDSRRSSSRK